MKKYTHLARIYGFKCYFNINTNELEGTNWFNEKLIGIFIKLDFLLSDNEGFYIELIEEL